MDRIESARIGRQIAKLRKQQNITTTELARRVGLSQPQISRLENGKQGFRSETLLKISRALGVRPAHFFVDEIDAVKAEMDKSGAVRAELGSKLADTIERQYGEIAVTPVFRGLLKRLAEVLAKDSTDTRVLRNILDKVLEMSDAQRRDLLQHMNSSYGRNRRKSSGN